MRTLDDQAPVELVEFVIPNPLAPGESSTIEEKIDVDYCTTQTICNKVYAEGNNPVADVCQDEDEYKIDIAPQCIIDSNLTCTEQSTGLDCDLIPPVDPSVCDCSVQDCTTTVVFETCAINEGPIPLEITEYTITLDGQVSNVLQAPTTILTGQSFCPPGEVETISLCSSETYTACSEVSAVDMSGTTCDHKSPLEFTIDVPPPIPPPTPPPTLPPVPIPVTPPPSASPTEQCVMDISADCDGCDFNTTELPGCEGRPSMFGMLFRGGSCDENNFTQPIDRVECADFNGGPPKTGTNESAYVVALGKDQETVVFAGMVNEGSVYYLYNGGDKLDADQTINIYSDETQTTLLQSVTFHASCSQPLVLKNVFGASQIVQFANEDQGNVSCFLATEVSYQISVPIDLPEGEDSIIIRELTVRTNYTNPAFIDLSPMINGTVLTQNSPPLEVSFEATLNLAIPQAYETILTVTGEASNSGQICRGADYSIFFAPLNEAPPDWAPVTPNAFSNVLTRH